MDDDMPSRDDECYDPWHIGAEVNPEQWCPSCGWCDTCGVECECDEGPSGG